MKILVTGAAGFIGAALSIRLLERGDEIIGLDNLNDYYEVSLKEARLGRLNGHPRFRFLRVDVADRAAMEQVFATEQPERVMHLAAQAGVRYSLTHPHAYVDANLVGFMTILEGCRHNGIEHLFTVYGPWGRPDMSLFSFTRSILAGQPIEVFNYGHHQRDFTYIDDLVEGVMRVIDAVARPNPAWSGDSPDPGTSRAPYRLYNIGNNHPVNLLRFIEVLEGCLGRVAEKKLLPMQPGDVPDTYADVKDLVDDVAYRPATPVEVGVERFVNWYRDYYQVG
jgi:UDP-glucuronate 4-epimerase